MFCCRVGLLPPIQRPLQYLTGTKPSRLASSPPPNLQPVLSRVRASKQPNKQPGKGAALQGNASIAAKSSTSADTVDTLVKGFITGAAAQEAARSSHSQDVMPNSSQQNHGMSDSDPALGSDKAATSSVHVALDMEMEQLNRNGRKGSNNSPKRSLGVHNTTSRHSTRIKSLRTDN